jgi:glycine C-acetyltransferase
LDAYAHASLVDGAVHSGARVHYFRHNDMDSLEDLLRDIDNGSNRILIGTEGVFSADGDYGDIAGVVALAKKYGAKVLVDEAHSLLLTGEAGRGVCAQQGVLDDVDILVGTFSKSFGGVGGFALTKKALANYFGFFSRNRLFSCALDPAVTGGLIESLRVAEGAEGDDRRRRLVENSQHLRTLLDGKVPLTGTSTWIVPVVFEREAIVSELSEHLLEAGMIGSMMMFPSVPKGKARLRLFVSSEHTAEQLERAANIIIKAGERFGFATLEPQAASAE